MVCDQRARHLYTVKAGLDSMLDRGPRPHRRRLLRRRRSAPSPPPPSTAATKAADRGFAEALRHELSGTGISLTTVYPGEVATDLHSHQMERLPDWRRGDEAIEPGASPRT